MNYIPNKNEKCEAEKRQKLAKYFWKQKNSKKTLKRLRKLNIKAALKYKRCIENILPNIFFKKLFGSVEVMCPRIIVSNTCDNNMVSVHKICLEAIVFELIFMFYEQNKQLTISAEQKSNNLIICVRGKVKPIDRNRLKKLLKIIGGKLIVFKKDDENKAVIYCPIKKSSGKSIAAGNATYSVAEAILSIL